MIQYLQHRLAGRTRLQWVVRLALTLGAVLLGVISVTGSLANVIARVDPERAHALAPRNGVITAALAMDGYRLVPSGNPVREPARMARLALRQDPTAVEALSVLALQAQLRNDLALARRIFTVSNALSRRELEPQIWGIEEAVTRGDINGALRHYDIALRSSRSASETLFPVLASAIGEARIRAMLLQLMGETPVWGEDFVNFVADRAINPAAAVLFFREGEAVNLPVDNADRARIVDALAATGDYESAWRYYTSFTPGAERNRIRAGDFAQVEDVAPTLFDWRTSDNVELFTGFSREGGGNADFSAPPSTGGILLRQAQLLPPGRYRLQGRSSGVEQPENSLPYWMVTCIDGRELGRVNLPSTGPASGEFSGDFVVPGNCPVQTLLLMARSSDAIGGVTGRIEEVQLASAR